MTKAELILFGTSRVTTWLGYLLVFLDLLGHALKEQPIPQTLEGWIGFAIPLVTAFALRMSKDDNKSNAQNPRPESIIVPAMKCEGEKP